MKEYIIVWRGAEDAALQTYALPNKSARVFTDLDVPEAAEAEAVDEAGLVKLLAVRDAFSPKRVDRAVAKKVLGWTV